VFTAEHIEAANRARWLSWLRGTVSRPSSSRDRRPSVPFRSGDTPSVIDPIYFNAKVWFRLRRAGTRIWVDPRAEKDQNLRPDGGGTMRPIVVSRLTSVCVQWVVLL